MEDRTRRGQAAFKAVDSRSSLDPAIPQFVAVAVFTAFINTLFQFFLALHPSVLSVYPMLKGLLETLAAAIFAVPPAYYFYRRPLHRAFKERQNAEMSLRKSEMHYRVVSELTTTFVFDLLVSENGKVSLAFLSDNFYAFAQVSKQEARTFESLFSHIVIEDRDKLVEGLRNLISKPQSTEIECRAYVDDPRELRWLSVCGRSEWDEIQGRVTAIYGAVKDITEQKRAIETLRENEEKYRFMFNNEIYAINVVDFETLEVLDANEACLRMYGYSKEELLCGTTLLDLTAERDSSQKAIDQITKGGSVFIPLRLHRKRDGTVFPVEIVAASYVWKGRKASFGIIHDITKRVQADEALRESEQKFRVLFDSEMFAIHVFDMETLEILDINERHISLYGYSREEMTSGMTILDLTAKENETKKAIDQLRSVEALYVPLRYQRKKDGGIFPAAFVNAFYVWKGRKVCLASIRDISERKRAEDEQARVQNLLAVSQRIAHIGSWEYEYSTGKMSLSEEMYRIAGIPDNSPIPSKFAESFLPPKEFLHSRKAIEICLQHSAPYVIDYEIQRPDGQRRTLHNEGEIVFDELGEPIRVFGTSQDITERKKAEEALQASQQLIEGLLNAIPAGVFWKDRNLIFLGCDEAFARDAGFASSKDVIGKDDFQMSWRQYAEQYRRDDQEVIESGRPKLFIEEPHENAYGQVFTVLTSKVPLRNSKGEITGVLGAYMDITEQRRTEQALRENENKLRESEAKYKRLIEAAPASIFVIQDEKIVFLNNHVPGLSGYSREELLGLPVQKLFSDGDWESSRNRQQERLQGKSLPSNITSHKTKNGSTIWVETVGVLIDWEGKPAVLYFVSDITDRKAAENERIEYEQYLQQAQRLESLGVLAGGIAHDFNNILTGIFGYADLARSEAKDETVSEYLSQAMESMERAKSLTQQLLTFSKGGAPIKKIVPMPPLIKETCKFALHGSNVRGKYDIQDDLWHCEIDKNQIGQVIQNLILNAIQAMPMGGTIEIAASNISIRPNEYPALKEGNYVAIAIKDQGTGMSEEMLSRIFDPFFTTKTKGHGLGLAISHSIINRHGGAIDVKSELGQGTTFTVYLPACDEALVASSESPSFGHVGTGRILVLDDEAPLRELISLMLQSFGYSVVDKENGKDALSAFLKAKSDNNPFKAVILDLTIPGGMGGKEVAEEIRKIDKKVPLFVASGYAADPIMAQPGDYGFTASISKPFKMAELMEMLEKHMGKG
jgi:PAS domain S-box-containing protein